MLAYDFNDENVNLLRAITAKNASLKNTVISLFVSISNV